MEQVITFNEVKDKISYSKISEHPCQDCYMLHSVFTTIPPYFGTYDECVTAKKHLDAKVKSELYKLPAAEADELIRQLVDLKLITIK